MENETIKTSTNSVFAKTFLWMFLGLFMTGFISWYTFNSKLFIDIVYNNMFNVLMIVELAVVLLFSFLFRKLPPTIVAILFFVYAALNGVTMSVIFAVFELSSITMIFFATAGIFAILSLIGYFTKVDLSKVGPVLYMGIFIGFILSIVNIFLGNSLLDVILTWVLLIIFLGVTIYDIQKIKLMSNSPEVDVNKVHIYGAMQIYLDFINIFLRILAIFGRRK